MKIIKITGGYPPSGGAMGGTSVVAHELVKSIKKTGLKLKCSQLMLMGIKN